MKLTIVIPVYNETENIVTEIEALESQVSEPHIINIIYDFDKNNSRYSRRRKRFLSCLISSMIFKKSCTCVSSKIRIVPLFPKTERS